MAHPIRIFSLAEWSDGAGWRWALQHGLDTHALIWITQGQGLCTIEARRRGFGVHNAFALPANTLFSFEFGSKSLGLVTLIPVGTPILMPDDPQHLRIRDARMQTDLTAILDALRHEQLGARAFADEAMVAQAHLLTVWLRRAMIAQGGPPERLTATEELVRGFAALVERHFRSGMPMMDYARRLGVTPTHLSRCCRNSCGLTAAEILTQRVTYEARLLLETTAQPIQSIASQLGFNSAAYFSRFILQNTGRTPSDIRRNRQKH